MIDRHAETAQAVAKDTGWDIDQTATEHGWAGVGLGPVGRHRDSEALERSNWEVIEKDLSEAYPDDFSTASFSHWAVGWVEEMIWNVSNADLRTRVDHWRDRLDRYPVANEEHYSELEYEELSEYLDNEIAAHDLPDEITADDVFQAIMDTGDIQRADDVSDETVRNAIAAALEDKRIANATPSTDQGQLVSNHGRPHTGIEE